MNNGNLPVSNTEATQGNQSLIGRTATEVVTAVESMSQADGSDRWQELPENDRTRIWGELDWDHKERLFKKLSNECREPLWNDSDAATKLVLFSGLSEGDKRNFWGSLSEASKESLWNSLTGEQKGTLLWQVPKDDMIATWRQWSDSIRHEILDAASEPILAYFYRQLPADLRPVPAEWTGYLNRRWSASSNKPWASKPLKSSEDLKIIWRGLSETSRNALWGLLSSQNKLSLFGQLSNTERNTLWGQLSSSLRDEFWNSLDATAKVKLFEMLSITDRNAFWQTLSLVRQDALWQIDNTASCIFLLVALSPNARDAMLARQTPAARHQLWAGMDTDTSIQGREIQKQLANALSTIYLNEFWHSADPNTKVKRFRQLSVDKRNTFWQTIPLDQRDALWRDIDMGSRISLLLALSQNDCGAMWVRRTPVEDRQLWAAASLTDKRDLGKKLSPNHQIELWNSLDFSAKAELFDVLRQEHRNSLWGAISPEQRNALWSDLDSNAKVKLFGQLSFNHRNAFWYTFSPDQHDTLWVNADVKRRISLMKALLQKDRDALLERRTPDDRHELWTAADFTDKRNLGNMLSPNHQQELWNRLDSNGKAQLFGWLSRENRDSLWETTSPEQRNTLWSDVDSNAKVKLLENLSDTDRDAFWRTFSPDQHDELWQDIIDVNKRISLLKALSQAHRDAIWKRRTLDEGITIWTGAAPFYKAELANALSLTHRLALFNSLDLNAKADLFRRLLEDNRNSLWQELTLDQRNNLWRHLDPNARIKLFEQLSIIHRNALWETLSVAQQEALWRNANVTNRLTLLMALSQDDRNAMWERRTLDEHHHLWAASVYEYGAITQRVALLGALSPVHRNEFWERLPQHEQEGFWNRCGSVQQVDLMEGLSQSNQHALLRLVSATFNHSNWGRSFSARDQVRLLGALSPNDRDPLWQRLGTEGQIRLFRRLPMDARHTLRTFLSGERYDALVDAASKPIREVVESLLEHPEIAAGIGDKRDDLLNKVERIANDAKAAVISLQAEVVDVLQADERDDFMNKIEELEENARTAVKNIKAELAGDLPGDKANPVRKEKQEALAVARERYERDKRGDAKDQVEDLLEELAGDLPGDEPNSNRRERQEALAAAKRKVELIVALQEARAKHEQISNFSFVCERESAALLGEKDPATEQTFLLPSPQKDKKQIPKILLQFAYNEDAQQRIGMAAGQGITGCVDNLINAVSEFHRIHVTEEAQEYKETYKLLDAIFEQQGWNTIDNLVNVRVAGLASDGESVEHRDAIEMEVGNELDMSTTLEEMAHGDIGGKQADFDRWRATARTLRVNNGKGDLEKANRLAEPDMEAARRQMASKGQQFVPPHFVGLVDFVRNNAVWGEKWRTHIEATYPLKFDREANPALRAVLRDSSKRQATLLDAQEKLEEANEEARRGRNTQREPVSVMVAGIGPITSENIDHHLLDAMRSYDAEAEAAKENIHETLTNESVAACLQIRAALKTHTGPTWQLLPVGNPDADQAMKWDQVTPAVQLQLEMVQLRKPDAEIIIGPEYSDTDKPRIWIAAQLLDLTVQGMDNNHPLLLASDHKAAIDGLTLRRNELPADSVEERERLTAKIAEQERMRGQKRRNELPGKIEQERTTLNELIGQLHYPFIPEQVPEELRKQERLLMQPMRRALRIYSNELSKMQQEVQRAETLDDDSVLRIENYIRNQKLRNFPDQLTQRLEAFTGTRERELRKNVQTEHITVNAMIEELTQQKPTASLEEDHSMLLRTLTEYSEKLGEMDADLRSPTDHLQLYDMETYLTVQQEKRFSKQTQAQIHKIKLAVQSLSPTALGQRQMLAVQHLTAARTELQDQRQLLKTQMPRLRQNHPDWITLDQTLEQAQLTVGQYQTRAEERLLGPRGLIAIEQSLAAHQSQQRKSYSPELNRLAAKERVEQRRQIVGTGLEEARVALDNHVTDLNNQTLNKPVLHEQHERTRTRWQADLATIEIELARVRDATPQDLTRMQGVVDEERNSRTERAQYLDRIRNISRWLGSGRPPGGGDDQPPGPGGAPQPPPPETGGPSNKGDGKSAATGKSKSKLADRTQRVIKWVTSGGKSKSKTEAEEERRKLVSLIENHLLPDEKAEIDKCAARLVAVGDKLGLATKVMGNGAVLLVQLVERDQHAKRGEGTLLSEYVFAPAELYKEVGIISTKENDQTHEHATAESILSTINKSRPFTVKAETWEKVLSHIETNGLTGQLGHPPGRRRSR
ncbi:MAG: hypothetical protein V4568_15020 [Pseudomonadota bacterium]